MAAGPTRQQLRIGTRASPMARAMANNVMKSIIKIAPLVKYPF